MRESVYTYIKWRERGREKERITEGEGGGGGVRMSENEMADRERKG